MKQNNNNLFNYYIRNLKINIKKKKIKITGLTLVEVMIAMMLGCIILSGVIQGYLTLKNVFNQGHQLGRLQENIRSISPIFSDSVHEAGEYGCTSAKYAPILFIAPSMQIYSSLFLENKDLRIIKNTDINKSLFLPNNIAEKIKNNRSDILWVIEKNVVDKEKLKSNLGVAQVFFALSDCYNIIYFSGKDLLDSNFKRSLLEKYDNNPEVINLYQINLRYYHIANTERKNQSGVPVTALYCFTLGERSQELVEGVEELVIKSVGLVESRDSGVLEGTNLFSPDYIQLDVILSSVEGNPPLKKAMKYIYKIDGKG